MCKRKGIQWMIFLNRNDTIVKEKYNQLFLSLQIGGIRTMNNTNVSVHAMKPRNNRNTDENPTQK